MLPIMTSKPCTGIPGDFDSWTLAYSFAPNYCNTHPEDKDVLECIKNSSGGYVYDWTLHGLWPDYSANSPDRHGCDYPQYCQDKYQPTVQELNAILDTLASEGLDWKHIAPEYADGTMLMHEYTKHATCSGLLPLDYFRIAFQQAYKYINTLDKKTGSDTDLCLSKDFQHQIDC